MSLADLKEYGKRCVEEPDLRKKAKEIGLENIAGQIANAKTLGLTFTEHDFMALTKGVGTAQELTEEQLQDVAGGILPSQILPIGLPPAGALGGGGGQW